MARVNVKYERSGWIPAHERPAVPLDMELDDVAVGEDEILLDALTVKLPRPPDFGEFQIGGEILVNG